MKLRSIIALALAFAIPAPALAQTHVIAQLGSAPLVGEISSTQELQTDVSRDRYLFATAGSRLGLSPAEYAQFQARIQSKRLAYVTIPRRLDAMSWSSGGHVYVLHDVEIPAGTKGWEIDLQEHHQLIALFIPARCGNLSIVRRSLPVIAQSHPRHRAVAAISQPPAAPIVPPVFAQAPAPAPAPAAPVATPAPYQSLAASTAPPPSAAPASHHFRLWPLLLLPLVALLAGGSHGGSSSPATLVVPPPLPPASCPTSAFIH